VCNDLTTRRCLLHQVVIICVLLTQFLQGTCWLPKEVAKWAIEDFEQHEKNRSSIQFKGTDRRVSWPFISGDGFRHLCNHICEDANRCRMDPAAVKDGECIFVKTDFFEFFAKDVINRIPSTSRFIIISHNGDLSAPDGQNDAPRIGMPKYVTSDILAREYASGRLIAHHGQNLWWVNKTTSPRPEFSHCLPIGFENRQYPIGRQIHVYNTALQRFVIDRPVMSVEEQSKKPLLLVAFYPKSRVPDRSSVLSILRVYPPKGVPKDPNPFYNYTDLNHMEWLQAIGEHRFVLAPFGHGLDTHRVSEILMMGGIPVMRRSTISSCYDDSDNSYVADGHRGTSSASAGAKKPIVKTRGSLPVVIVDRWEDVTKERLESEWQRLSKIPDTHWDWKRLFIYQWIDRILAR
jgi:hypothetical protein